MKTFILFVPFGSYGDVYPLLSLAIKCSGSGNVLVAANEYYRDLVEAEGLEFRGIGDASSHREYLQETKDMSGETSTGRYIKYKNLIESAYESTRNLIEQLYDLHGKRLVVVTNGNLSPATLICEKLEIPVIFTALSPWLNSLNKNELKFMQRAISRKVSWLKSIVIGCVERYHSLTSPINLAINAHRRRYGLKPGPTSFLYYFYKILYHFQNKKPWLKYQIALYPNWLELGYNSLPDGHYLGFAGFDQRDHVSEHLVDKFIAMHGSPIVFTPGSVVEDAEKFLEPAIEVGLLLKKPIIVVARFCGDEISAKLSASGANILVLKYVSMRYLLPKSALLIHHGGIGTAAAAIKAGVPQIIRPRMYDQSSNGLRLMQLGLGVVLFAEQYTAQRIIFTYNFLVGSKKHQEMLAYYMNLVNHSDPQVRFLEFIRDTFELDLATQSEPY